MFEEKWSWLNYYYSTEHVQTYLHKCYAQQNIENAHTWSYTNADTFIYYLKHGYHYYTTAEKAPVSIQPVLLFYGYIQFMKACLLTVDPAYPENTSVLSHGVTTRKRKKKQYQFLEDQIKIQKNGLFTHFFMKVFHVEHLENEKYSMFYLLQHLPEMNDIFLRSINQSFHLPLEEKEQSICLPLSIIDELKMTSQHFLRYLKNILQSDDPFIKGNKIMLRRYHNEELFFGSPFRFHWSNQQFYFPTHKKLIASPLNELMIHYLLLYNLSMVCRYETEWWGEVRHHFSNKDFPYITYFLALTKNKIPFYISYLLEKNLSK